MDEDGVEGGVKDTNKPFEDSKRKVEDAIVSLNKNEGRGRAFLFRNLRLPLKGF